MTKLTRTISLASTITVLVLLWAPLYPVLAEDGRAATPSTTTGRGFSKVTAVSLETRREEINKRIEDFRLKLASREATLKTRLDKFKDQNRAQIAQRVSQNLNSINKNRTDAMTKHLDTLSDILGKAQARVASDSASSTAIASASASITVAMNSVNLQAQKDYTINATSEATLFSELKAKRDLLFKDLSNTRKLILDAKQAVITAVRAVIQEKGISNG